MRAAPRGSPAPDAGRTVADRRRPSRKAAAAPVERLLGVLRVHDREGSAPPGPTSLPERRHLGQADGSHRPRRSPAPAPRRARRSRSRPPRTSTAADHPRLGRRRPPGRQGPPADPHPGSREDSAGPPSRDHHRAEPLRRRARSRARAPPRPRAAPSSPITPPSTSSSALNATVTSRRRGSGVAPVRWSIDSRTSTALPAVRPRTWFMSVSSAEVGFPLPVPISTIARASSRAARRSAGTRRSRP